MKRFLIPLALLVCALATRTASADETPITRAIRLIDGQEAAFVQRFLPRGYKKEQVEAGKVVFGKAPASRWTYDTPEEKTFIFDGETSWMYVPADETVMVHKVSAEEKRRLPFFVLADPDQLKEWYRIEEAAGITKLTAKGGETLLRSIQLELDASGRLKTLAYTDSQGNRTEFELSQWNRAVTTDETFTFTLPPGVDVIEN